jgi:hypothetical protein
MHSLARAQPRSGLLSRLLHRGRRSTPLCPGEGVHEGWRPREKNTPSLRVAPTQAAAGSAGLWQALPAEATQACVKIDRGNSQTSSPPPTGFSGMTPEDTLMFKCMMFTCKHQCLMSQFLSHLRLEKTPKACSVCVFITAGPSTKQFTSGGAGIWHLKLSFFGLAKP